MLCTVSACGRLGLLTSVRAYSTVTDGTRPLPSSDAAFQARAHRAHLRSNNTHHARIVFTQIRSIISFLCLLSSPSLLSIARAVYTVGVSSERSNGAPAYTQPVYVHTHSVSSIPHVAAQSQYTVVPITVTQSLSTRLPAFP